MQPALQEITNRLNQVNNILVTVKSNPSVDELAAALGLTLALNNYGKHATAVFSGQIPDAMSFLKPQKTFENTVHSLRDFIISLNKEKADKLRFAKDGEIVKIYITPYKSTITPTDLAYSEGDFNVEMVLAIGINTKEELDTVIAAHGRILHEATVATIMAGPTPSQLGSINWSDPTLTSASAMALQMLQSLGNPNLLSPEVSTALLTGIVADTDRFSNTKTSPRVMELSAQLMNSGADHQLVTSSIGAGAHQARAINSNANTTAAPINPASSAADSPQELVLDLHAPAANTSPMVNSPVTPQSNIQTSSAAVSQEVAQLLPQPVDITEPVVPANLMPPTQNPQMETSMPAQPSSEPVTPQLAKQQQQEPAPQVTPQEEPTLTSQPLEEAAGPSSISPSPVDSTDNQEEQIKSEIDKIYSAEPFDPANNPRQDVGSNVALPVEETAEPQDSASNNQPVFVDTSVQQSQANNSALQPIEATKDEVIDPSSVLGASVTQPGIQPNLTPEIPGLEMPPQITLPPPPPNPLAGNTTSTIDTQPFGSPIQFDKQIEQTK